MYERIFNSAIKSNEFNERDRLLFAGLRFSGDQQGVRLLRAEVPECKRGGALAEPEEPYRTADRRRRGASEIRPEG